MKPVNLIRKLKGATASAATLAVAALFLLAPPPLRAQAIPLVQTASMKKARQVLDDALTAVGGPAFLRLRNKVERGRMYSFHNEQLAGLAYASVYIQYLDPPEQLDADLVYLRERQSYGKKKESKKEDWAVLFTEDDGYEVTFRGFRPLDVETVERYRKRRLNDILYILKYRLNEPGMLFESRPREIVDNYPMEVVNIIDRNNNLVTAYFHYSTRLPARVQFEMRDEYNVRHVETVIYDKFRDAGDGVQLPWVTQRQRDGERIFSMFAESIEINVDLDPALMTLPEGVEILERKQ